MNRPLRVLVLKDENQFVAQALEIDIAAQGPSEEEALRRLNAVLKAEQAEAKNRGKAITDIGPAPAKFHHLFEADIVSRKMLDAA
jgi:hypothetical protein